MWGGVGGSTQSKFSVSFKPNSVWLEWNLAWAGQKDVNENIYFLDKCNTLTALGIYYLYLYPYLCLSTETNFLIERHFHCLRHLHFLKDGHAQKEGAVASNDVIYTLIFVAKYHFTNLRHILLKTSVLRYNCKFWQPALGVLCRSL